MADGEETVVMDGHEAATREAALAQVSSDPGFCGAASPADPEGARAQARGYTEKLWRLGEILDGGGAIAITPEGIRRAVEICEEGAEHADYALRQSGQAKGFLSAMFGSCAQGREYAQKVGEWMDRMGEEAAALHAILNGVADGTQEIKAKAEQTDSAWADAFRKAGPETPVPSVRGGGPS